MKRKGVLPLIKLGVKYLVERSGMQSSFSSEKKMNFRWVLDPQ
tara:strand:- start:85 stop:213 length:129 start_codon:yes stop_codon:yes gene_type:complete